MPTGDLFGSSYSYGNSGGNASGSGAPAVGDVVEVAGGITGIIMSIIGGIAQIQREDGQVEEQAAAQVIVLPAPPAAPMDWTPIAIGGGIILALLLFVGMRR
jgi:hypothetical protein